MSAVKWRPAPNWVRMENRPAGPPVLSRYEGWPPVEVQPLETWHKCTRCGEEVEIKFPTLAADWVATAEGFAEAHRNCRYETRNVR